MIGLAQKIDIRDFSHFLRYDKDKEISVKNLANIVCHEKVTKTTNIDMSLKHQYSPKDK